LAYTGLGALVGVAVLLVGAFLFAALPSIENFLQINKTRRNEDEVSTL
jgi:hypothetical protein